MCPGSQIQSSIKKFKSLYLDRWLQEKIFFYLLTTAQVTGQLFAKKTWGLLTLSLNKVSTNDKPNSLPKLDVTWDL